MVLAQRLHGQETGKLRRRLNFGQAPFGATKQNQSDSKHGRSRSARSASSLHCMYVIPNGEGKVRAPATMLTATASDGAAMRGGKRRQDSPRSKPKAAERYVQIHLQTVRTRRLLPLSSPHTFDRTRPTKSNLSYMKKLFILHSSERELRNFRLNVFGPLHGRIKHFFRHVEHS